MELHEKIFPTTLDMKNANNVQKKFFFQNNLKDRITHFNISVTVKRKKVTIITSKILLTINEEIFCKRSVNFAF